MNANEYKGFSLFNDIEDVNLRNRNRAITLSNIASNHSKDRKIPPATAGMILNYFNLVDGKDKEDVMKRFMEEMNLRGFHLVSPKYATN